MAKRKETQRQAAVEKVSRSEVEPELRITQALIDNVKSVAKACGATAVFVYIDALGGRMLSLPGNLGRNVYYVSRSAAEEESYGDLGAPTIRVPNVSLTRMGQVKIAVFLALSHGIIKRGDVIICLSGIAASGALDTMIIMQVDREFELYASSRHAEIMPPAVSPEVVERIIDIATELGDEGREGKPVGALFVVGDSERVLSLSRQLILNPFRGYSEEQRNILDPLLKETVKELSTIDGAFIVRGDGVVESCGAFLKTASQEEHELPRGLGARHHAAAGITAVSDSIAVTVSESTGRISIFRGGAMITEIDKPRAIGAGPKLFTLAHEE